MEPDPDFPGVPTFKEQGLPGVVIESWYGLAVPAKTPEEVIVKLKDAFEKTSQNKEIQMMLKQIGFIPVSRNADEFGKYAKMMEDMYIRVAKIANIKVQ